MSKNSLATRIVGRLRRDLKRVYWTLATNRGASQQVLFIVGCQRSGTSMLLDLFGQDFRSRTFSEFSAISGQPPDGIRMKPLNVVKEIFASVAEPLIVCKPLAESQKTREMLDFFPTAKALWSYRHFNDVANSNVNRFRSQIEGCRIIVEKEPNNWRSEVVPQDAYQLVRDHYNERMSPYNAAALIWFVRNRLFFEQNLQNSRRVRLCKYEDFVRFPAKRVTEIYTWLNLRPPGHRVINFVTPKSIGLGKNTVLHPDIEAHCSALLAKLDEEYRETPANSSHTDA